jgi:hypothetical protein
MNFCQHVCSNGLADLEFVAVGELQWPFWRLKFAAAHSDQRGELNVLNNGLHALVNIAPLFCGHTANKGTIAKINFNRFQMVPRFSAIFVDSYGRSREWRNASYVVRPQQRVVLRTLKFTPSPGGSFTELFITVSTTTNRWTLSFPSVRTAFFFSGFRPELRFYCFIVSRFVSYLVIYSMEQSPCTEANMFSATQ